MFSSGQFSCSRRATALFCVSSCWIGVQRHFSEFSVIEQFFGNFMLTLRRRNHLSPGSQSWFQGMLILPEVLFQFLAIFPNDARVCFGEVNRVCILLNWHLLSFQCIQLGFSNLIELTSESAASLAFPTLPLFEKSRKHLHFCWFEVMLSSPFQYAQVGA